MGPVKYPSVSSIRTNQYREFIQLLHRYAMAMLEPDVFHFTISSHDRGTQPTGYDVLVDIHEVVYHDTNVTLSLTGGEKVYEYLPAPEQGVVMDIVDPMCQLYMGVDQFMGIFDLKEMAFMKDIKETLDFLKDNYFATSDIVFWTPNSYKTWSKQGRLLPKEFIIRLYPDFPPHEGAIGIHCELHKGAFHA